MKLKFFYVDGMLSVEMQTTSTRPDRTENVSKYEARLGKVSQEDLDAALLQLGYVRQALLQPLSTSPV